MALSGSGQAGEEEPAGQGLGWNKQSGVVVLRSTVLGIGSTGCLIREAEEQGGQDKETYDVTCDLNYEEEKERKYTL